MNVTASLIPMVQLSPAKTVCCVTHLNGAVVTSKDSVQRHVAGNTTHVAQHTPGHAALAG